MNATTYAYRGTKMRKLTILLMAVMLTLVACGPEEDTTTAGGTSEEGCDLENPPLHEEGKLTVATDKPAYPPWFTGSPKAYSGYEGDLASTIAQRMGLEIVWVVEPFNKSYAPGAKDYDFDINQITITPERAEAVDFSDGYFDNNQGVLVPATSKLLGAKSLDDLKDVQFGTQVGTTSLSYINEQIEPTSEPKVFDTTNDVKSAFESGQIDALVTDLVTTVYLRDFEIKGTEVVGQLPGEEEFGMLFEKGNPLVECVNQVLAEIKEDGTLEALADQHLQQYLTVPSL